MHSRPRDRMGLARDWRLGPANCSPRHSSHGPRLGRTAAVAYGLLVIGKSELRLWQMWKGWWKAAKLWPMNSLSRGAGWISHTDPHG